jgi:hypothetical protein
MNTNRDLATLRPDIAKQWDSAKNGELKPDQVAVRSARKVWWVCESGHQWGAMVSSRTRLNGTSCPYCSGNKILPGYNDLATLRPAIAKQWHSTRNEDLTPEQVMVSSARKVWWVCESGHEWEAMIRSRTQLNGTGCPSCVIRHTVHLGRNDLATLRPDIAKQWDSARNGELTPSQVTVSSGRKVWWVCERGHEWESRINTRTGKRGSGCPSCATRGRHALLPGYNDLATRRPNTAKQWNSARNGELTPDQVRINSRPKVWWVGDEWT